MKMKITLNNMLAYLQDCHGLNASDLQAYDVDTKSKVDVLDAIKSYGWFAEFNEYNQ
jgi:ribosomal protein S8